MSAPPSGGWWPPRDDQGYGPHSRAIMFTAVLSLFFVLVVVVALHLYARYFLRRRRGSRHTIASLFRADPPRAGLDPSVISALPTFAYKSPAAAPAAVEAGAEEAAAADCAVCLCALEEGEVVMLLPNCSHVFHAGCVDMWLHSHTTCPICRAEVEPAPAAQAETPRQPELNRSNSNPPAAAAATAAGAATAEGTSGAGKDQEGSTSRLNSSLRRMLSRGRSQRRTQTNAVEDLERQ